MTVYLEAVIGVNFLADFALLWLTGRCLGYVIRYGRIAAAATLGAAYALLYLLTPTSPAFALPGKLLAAALMLRLAFRPAAARQWGSAASVFVIASAAMAGVTFALNLPRGAIAAGSAIVLPSSAPLSLPAAFAAAAASAFGLAAGLRRLERLRGLRVSSTVTVGGRSAQFIALVDTGNELRDPLSGRPVMVVEYQAISPVLPPAYQGLLREGLGLEPGGEGDPDWQARLRFIPYRSLGRARGGVLFGFAPDDVQISLPGRAPAGAELVVAVSPSPLAGHGAFQAILPASVAVMSGYPAA